MNRITTHLGEYLKEELMLPYGVTSNALAIKLNIPPNRISELVHCKRSVTPNTALRLAHFFNMTPNFWLNMQSAYDLSFAMEQDQSEIDKLPVLQVA
jgi:antitoxin HigA-1